ncbi:MAG TPA: Ppx/GppA phosphatase family protein [Acidimicrobiales bacterium]|nr:Ppx/GppA phosphatase family protein [Acidimicrobiales bacterium]
MNVAAIDCGTNSTRLLVADHAGRAVDRRMTITRLGEGVDASGRLGAQAIDRVLDVLREYKEVIDRHDVKRIRMAATSAARDASNRDGFFDACEQILGVRPELLSGDEEGRLSFRGATTGLDPSEGPFLVVDIGGGSTEFVAGTTEPDGVLSVDIGCVRVTEKFLHSDPPDAGELSDAMVVIRQHLDDVVREVPSSLEARRFIGLAGTVTTIATVELGVPYNDEQVHHLLLTKDAAEDVFRTLATERLRDRVHNPGLERERADVIVGGALVLVTIMRYFDFAECLVSVSDILDGLVLSLLD